MAGLRDQLDIIGTQRAHDLARGGLWHRKRAKSPAQYFRTRVRFEDRDGIIFGMTEELDPDQPAKLPTTRRKASPDAPNLQVVGSAGAPKRPREPKAGVQVSSLFRSQPIPGTGFSMRDVSVGQAEDMLEDATNAGLDDREFAVRAVERQVRGEPQPSLEDVRAWDDDQLLAAAKAMLSFPPLHVRVDGIEQPEDPADAVVIPDPLTFASFREAVPARPRRMYSSIADTARRISELGGPLATGLLGSKATSDALKTILDSKVGVLGASGKNSAIESAMESIRNSPKFNMKLPELDLTKGIAAEINGLTDTAGIADSLAKFQVSTRAMEKLSRPIDVPVREPLRLGPIVPYHPEVDAIHRLGERLEAMTETQAAADREQLEVMTGQAELIRNQGVTISLVVDEVKGLRNDQRWPNRAVIIGAFLGGAVLMASIVAAVAAVMALSRA